MNRFLAVILIMSYCQIGHAVRCSELVSGNLYINWVLQKFAEYEAQIPELYLETAQSQRSLERKNDIQEHLEIARIMLEKEIDRAFRDQHHYSYTRFLFLRDYLNKIIYRIAHPRAPEVSSVLLEDYAELPALIEPKVVYYFQSLSQGTRKKIRFSQSIIEELFATHRYHGIDAARTFLHSIMMDVPGKNIKPLRDGIFELRTISSNYGHLRIFGFYHKGIFEAVKLSTAADHSGKKFSDLIDVVVGIRQTYD